MGEIDLLDAVNMLGLDYPTNKSSVNIICPNCGSSAKRRKTMNLDYKLNVWNCPRCSLGGGVLDFWAFHRDITDTDKRKRNKKAAADINEFREGSKAKAVTHVTKLIEEEPECAPLKHRDLTYCNMLDMLKLYNTHSDNLHARGLPEEVIQKNGYKSYPATGLRELCQSLLERGCILDGVPGFYKDSYGWTLLTMPSGIMIPIRTGRNEIQGLQVRLDEPLKGGGKYLTWSSPHRGARAKAYVHCNLGWKGDYSEIILTEGPLKADVIAHYTGFLTLGVPGVNSIRQLHGYLRPLKKRGTRKIHIAYDMDMFENEHVAQATEKLRKIIIDYGISCSVTTWDSSYKGLDDYLAAKHIK